MIKPTGLIIVLLFFLLLTGGTPLFSTVTLIAGGDVMLGSWASQVILEQGWDYPFRKLQPLLRSADIVFANLEAPFGEGGVPVVEKTYTFQVAPALVQTLVAGGINWVSLANNHILDFGQPALQKTMQLLQEHHIQFAGAGLNREQACAPAVREVQNLRFALLAYSLTFPQEFWATDTTAGTCFPSHTFVYRDVARLKETCDVVVVSCHWGAELRETPKDYQRDLAHRLIDAGADLVLGHHPHVVQGIERYRNGLIAYSLGNLVFGSYSEKAREGLLLKLEWEEDRLVRARAIPIDVYNVEREFQPEPLHGERKARFLEYLNQISLELNQGRRVITTDGQITLNILHKTSGNQSMNHQQEG